MYCVYTLQLEKYVGGEGTTSPARCRTMLYSKSSITTTRHATWFVPSTASVPCAGTTYASHSTCAAVSALAHVWGVAVSFRVQHLTIAERPSIVVRNTPLAMC